MGLTTLTPSCADCLKVWKPESLALSGPVKSLFRDCVTFFLAIFGKEVLRRITGPVLHVRKLLRMENKT